MFRPHPPLLASPDNLTIAHTEYEELKLSTPRRIATLTLLAAVVGSLLCLNFVSARFSQTNREFAEQERRTEISSNASASAPLSFERASETPRKAVQAENILIEIDDTRKTRRGGISGVVEGLWENAKQLEIVILPQSSPQGGGENFGANAVLAAKSRTFCGESGDFRIGDLMPGSVCVVLVENGLAFVAREDVIVSPGQWTSVKLSVATLCCVKGRVVPNRAMSLSALRIGLYPRFAERVINLKEPGSQPFYDSQLEDDGSFELKGVVPGGGDVYLLYPDSVITCGARGPTILSPGYREYLGNYVAYTGVCDDLIIPLDSRTPSRIVLRLFEPGRSALGLRAVATSSAISQDGSVDSHRIGWQIDEKKQWSDGYPLPPGYWSISVFVAGTLSPSITRDLFVTGGEVRELEFGGL